MRRRSCTRGRLAYDHANDLRKISKSRSPKTSLLDAITAIADQFKPHQLAHVLAQVMHESGGLFFDREVWGPTAAQKFVG